MADWNLGAAGLKVEHDGPLAWVRIDRPQARNALTPSMYFGIKRAVRLANTDPDTRALIITGTGDVFAPGGDLGGRYEPGDEPVPAGLTYETLPFVAIRESVAPVIAAVNGICQAGGLLIAMMADIAVVSEKATFRVPELLRGIVDASYAALLPAHVGVARARDLLLSARTLTAREAFDMGLVSRIVPHEDLEAEARKAAKEVLRSAPEARAHVKRMLNAAYQPIDFQTMFWSLQHSREPREGMKAFMEKRQPDWIPEGLD